MSTAESLKWVFIEVPADSRPTLEDDEHLVSDLIGMRVRGVDGSDLGIVKDIVSSPGQNLLQIESSLVPMVSEFVKAIDHQSRTITLAPIPGLLEDEEAEQP